MRQNLFTLRTFSGLNCGIGQGMNDIDLPTYREAITGYPGVPGPSIKGVLREEFSGDTDQAMFKACFGQGNDELIDQAASISVGDACLICLPVRSYAGTFAWVTSPTALYRFRQTWRRTFPASEDLPDIPIPSKGDYKAVTTETSELLIDQKRVLLEDLDLLHDETQSAQAWADRLAPLWFDTNELDYFKPRIAIVADDVFSFLCETALPVTTRTSIDHEKGTVKKGQLWYEEFVPPETLFCGRVAFDTIRKSQKKAEDIQNWLTESAPLNLQLGGNATIGRGLVQLAFHRSGGEV